MRTCPRTATVTGALEQRSLGLTGIVWSCGAGLVQNRVKGICHPLLQVRFVPRIAALSDGVLWALDRATFRALVVGSMAERAQRYQASLRRIPCLQHLTQASCSALLRLPCCGGRWQRLRGGAQRRLMPCSACARVRDQQGPEATPVTQPALNGSSCKGLATLLTHRRCSPCSEQCSVACTC